MNRIGRITSLAFLILILNQSVLLQENMPNPPIAKKIRREFKIHGDTLVDDYFWFREKSNPEVISYLESENAYTDAVMKPTEPFQQALYQEMLGRIKQTDLSVPTREGEYYYYSRTEEGKQYSILCRKKGSLDAPEQITLDLNELAKGLKFLGLGAAAVSNDGNLLAYSTDTTGYRQYTLQVKDLRTGQLFADRVEKTTSVTWANDSKTIFYGTEDHAKRPYRVFRHVLGQDPSKDELVYEEKDELYRLSANRSRSKGYIFLTSSSSTTSEVRYISADKPGDSPKILLPRQDGHEYYVDHHGDLFFIRTNDQGKNFRLVTAQVSDPQKKNWKEVLPHRKDSMLEGINCFADFYVAIQREDGLPRMRVTEIASGQYHYIEFPEPVYSAFSSGNPEFNTNKFRFSYQSFVTPGSLYEYDFKTRKRELLKEQEVLGGYDRKQYQSERIYAAAADGTKVPVSLVYKRELKRDGTRPLWLTGYGSYGSPSSVGFSSGRLSMLDRGVVYALAHIRGGGEMGKDWHDRGKMLAKKNTFTDFVACAEHLVKEKYTSKDRLVITGGSAGGLLMGAVVNMRPDLFKAVIAYVPFVDVLNTMLDPSLPLTIQEYLEWGNPNDKPYYDYIKTYSPYDNIGAKAYPAMLVRVSLNDSQVPYWEGTKFAAKLRATKTDRNVLLLKANMGAGHGGASGRYDALKDVAFDYAFLLSQLGINK
jgi:oligopeptidase B